MIAAVVERAPSRAVCLAFAQALAASGYTTEAVRNIKADRPRTVPQLPSPAVAHQLADKRRTSVVGSHAKPTRQANTASGHVRASRHGKPILGSPMSPEGFEGAQNRGPGKFAWASHAGLGQWPDVFAVDQLNAD